MWTRRGNVGTCLGLQTCLNMVEVCWSWTMDQCMIRSKTGWVRARIMYTVGTAFLQCRLFFSLNLYKIKSSKPSIVIIKKPQLVNIKMHLENYLPLIPHPITSSLNVSNMPLTRLTVEVDSISSCHSWWYFMCHLLY